MVETRPGIAVPSSERDTLDAARRLKIDGVPYPALTADLFRGRSIVRVISTIRVCC